MSDLGRRLIEQGAREEREAIVKAYNAYREDNLPADAFELAIESREGKRIEKMPEIYTSESQFITKINELIDAVNELREAKE